MKKVLFFKCYENLEMKYKSCCNGPLIIECFEGKFYIRGPSAKMTRFERSLIEASFQLSQPLPKQ